MLLCFLDMGAGCEWGMKFYLFEYLLYIMKRKEKKKIVIFFMK
jgi:hypothetical protein